MKKFSAALCIAFFTLACGGGGGSDSDEGYKLVPGSLSKYSDPGTTCDILYTGAPGAGPLYAVIFKGTVGVNSYVGISLDVDGDPSTSFNLKMYFSASVVPSGIVTLSKDADDLNIKINGTGVIDESDKTITLDFKPLQSDNTITIEGSGDKTISVNGSPLTINSIKAYYISGN